MKPLLSRKVTRGDVLNEWESAESHLTVDGLNAFKQRQRERMEAAKKQQAKQAQNKVTDIKQAHLRG